MFFLQLYYITTLKIPSLFDPFGIIIREHAQKIIMNKTERNVTHNK